MPDKPTFSLLNAARSQNAKPQAPVKAAESQPIQKPDAPSTQPTLPTTSGGLLGKGALSRPSTPLAPKPVTPTQNNVDANPPKPASLLGAHATASKGGLVGSMERAKEQQAVIKANHDSLFMEPPKDFRELLDKFDSFFAADTGISEFNLEPARDFVQRIFQDLKTDPNLDELMLDKDVGNVIEWVQKVKGEALAAGTLKKEKAETKASKAKPKSRFGDTSNLSLAIMPTTAKQLSDFGDI